MEETEYRVYTSIVFATVFERRRIDEVVAKAIDTSSDLKKYYWYEIAMTPTEIDRLENRKSFVRVNVTED